MNAVQGVTFEKDTTGINRYIRIDMLQHADVLRPLMQTLGIIPIDGWEKENLINGEFLDASDPKFQDVFSQGLVDIGDFKKFTADFVRKIENGDISIK